MYQCSLNDLVIFQSDRVIAELSCSDGIIVPVSIIKSVFRCAWGFD